MGRIVLNAVLLLVLIATVALGLARTDARNTNIELFPDMAHGSRYGAFEPNANFANGQTLQVPPSRAIARGMLPLPYAATPQAAVRAGEELSNPNGPGNERALGRGKSIFGNFCSECHGADGTGNGLIAQRGFPPPPSLLNGKSLTMKDGQLFHILTYGQNNMPSYASQLSREDRWDAVTYVRVLQTAARVTPTSGARQ